MKRNFLLIMVITALFTIDGSAQRNQLIGPAAKNHNPWKKPRLSESIVTKQPEQIIGPHAKNRKAWTDDCEMLPIVSAKRNNLTGPRVKNTFPVQHTYRKADLEEDNREQQVATSTN